MKIAHLSDTHLGYGGHGPQQWVEHPLLPGVRIKQREADILLGLERAVSTIVTKVQPDLVIHTGDLFDTSRPTAQTLDFAMTQLGRLTDAGFPVVLAEGVHSYPRDYRRGHVIKLLSHIPGITVFCEDEGQACIGDVSIHALPYRATVLGRVPQCPSTGGARYNVLVTHAVADSHRYFRGYRPAVDLAISECAGWYDYVALGHYHRFTQVPHTDRAFYSGSTAMVTWGDLRPGYRFGLNVVQLVEGQPPVVRRETIETRPMHAYGLDDAHGLTATEILDFLSRQANEVSPNNAYCQVTVENIDPLARREISMDNVEEIFGSAAGLERNLHARTQQWDAINSSLRDGIDPKFRLQELIAQMDGDNSFREDVLSLGRWYLEQAEEQIVAEDIASESRQQGRGVN